MELAPAGVPLSFEVTFDRNDLYVGMSVYNNSGASPILVGSIIPMHSVVGNTYQAKFSGVQGLSYVVFKAVYTDNSYSTIDTNYSQGSEAFICQQLTGGNVIATSLIGMVLPNPTLIGLIDC